MFNQVKGKTWITKEQARALQVTRYTLQVTRHTSHVTRYKLQVTTLGQVDSNDKSVRGHGDKRQFTLLSSTSAAGQMLKHQVVVNGKTRKKCEHH